LFFQILILYRYVTGAAMGPPLPKLRLQLDASGLLRVPLPADAGHWRINTDGDLEIATHHGVFVGFSIVPPSPHNAVIDARPSTPPPPPPEPTFRILPAPAAAVIDDGGDGEEDEAGYSVCLIGVGGCTQVQCS
jgi:hypothetical protein